MKKFSSVVLLILLAFLSIHCFCKGPELNKELIKSSELIFEGKILNVYKMEEDDNGNDMEVKFLLNKIYKGKKQDTILMRSKLSSCGFSMSFKNNKNKIGRIGVFYLDKIKGKYCYNVCDNRFLYKTTIKREYWEDNFYSDSLRTDSLYKEEIKKLTSLLAKK